MLNFTHTTHATPLGHQNHWCYKEKIMSISTPPPQDINTSIRPEACLVATLSERMTFQPATAATGPLCVRVPLETKHATGSWAQALTADGFEIVAPETGRMRVNFQVCQEDAPELEDKECGAAFGLSRRNGMETVLMLKGRRGSHTGSMVDCDVRRGDRFVVHACIGDPNPPAFVPRSAEVPAVVVSFFPHLAVGGDE